MISPVDFPEKNLVLSAPPNSTEDVQPLPIQAYPSPQNVHLIISKWKLDEDSLEQLKANGGHIFLCVHGNMHPAVSMSTKYVILSEDDVKAEDDILSQTDFEGEL